MQFVIQNSIVKAATLEERSLLGRLWDRLWAIERVPLYRDVEVRFHVAPDTPARPNDTLILANGTSWYITHFEQPQVFIARSTDLLTTETVQQMQQYRSDALVYAQVCPNDQEERIFNNPYV